MVVMEQSLFTNPVDSGRTAERDLLARLNPWLGSLDGSNLDLAEWDCAVAWQQVCHKAAYDGTAEELHAVRDRYEGLFAGYLRLLEGHQFIRTALDPKGDRSEYLEGVRARRQQTFDEIFGDWHTLEDLERKLVREMSIPNEKLLELAERSPPPQSWWDETDDPFAPAE